MTNCTCDIWITEGTHGRERPQWVCGLAFQSGEKKRGSFPCFSWNADYYFIWDRISIRKCVILRPKWLEGHVALPPKSQFRGQGIHTAISLSDLRDASLENTSGQFIWIAQFKLPFVMLICVHTGHNTVMRMIRNSNDHSTCALCSHVKTLGLYFMNWSKK